MSEVSSVVENSAISIVKTRTANNDLIFTGYNTLWKNLYFYMFKSIYPEEKLSFVLKEILVCYLGILVLHFFLFWQKKKKKKIYKTC